MHRAQTWPLKVGGPKLDLTEQVGFGWENGDLGEGKCKVQRGVLREMHCGTGQEFQVVNKLR